jgi:hypothetical protein
MQFILGYKVGAAFDFAHGASLADASFLLTTSARALINCPFRPLSDGKRPERLPLKLAEATIYV